MSNDLLEAAIAKRQRLCEFAIELKALAAEYANASEPLRQLLNEILNEKPELRLQHFTQTLPHLAGCDFQSGWYGNDLAEDEMTKPERVAPWVLMRMGEALANGDEVAYTNKRDSLLRDPALAGAVLAEFPTFVGKLFTRKLRALWHPFRERAEKLASAHGYRWSWLIRDLLKDVGETLSLQEEDAFQHWQDATNAQAQFHDGLLQPLGWRWSPTDAGIKAANPNDEDEQLTQEQCDEPVAQVVECTSGAEPPADAPPVPPPVLKPYVPLSGWDEIIRAINDVNGDRHTFRNNAKDQKTIRGVNQEKNGPIEFASQGGRPKAEKVALQEWWGSLADQAEEMNEERTKQAESERLSAEDAHPYGRDGTAIPGIGGGEKKRRRKA